MEGQISSYLDTLPIQLIRLNLEMLIMMKTATANVIASPVNYKEIYFWTIDGELQTVPRKAKQPKRVMTPPSA